MAVPYHFDESATFEHGKIVQNRNKILLFCRLCAESLSAARWGLMIRSSSFT